MDTLHAFATIIHLAHIISSLKNEVPPHFLKSYQNSRLMKSEIIITYNIQLSLKHYLRQEHHEQNDFGTHSYQHMMQFF